MATVQTTIPFKSRKLRTERTLTKSTHRNKDENKINIKDNNSRKRPKETVEYTEECSPKKISRHATNARNKTPPLCDISQQTAEEAKELPSRSNEIASLQDFLRCHLEDETSGSLYVSGQPGTGKTACLSYVLQLPQFKEGYKTAYINCTMVKSAGSIYHKICTELKLSTSGASEKACLVAIEKYLSKPHKMTLLVLDEIDQLDSRKQSVLYTVFSWTSCARMVLVGVANSLDLPTRVLPRLRAALAPRRLHFPPYTLEQIVHVLRATLPDAGRQFAPAALHMLAGKVAAVSGDMRRALALARRAAELARRAAAGGTVQLHQVLSVARDVYGGGGGMGGVEGGDEADDDSFPLQQKLLVCCLLLMLTHGNNKEVTVPKLYDVYKRAAEARHISCVSRCEFVSLCGLVEARGLVRLERAAGGRARGEARAARVRPQRERAELEAAVRGSPLLAGVLADVSCLGR